MGKRRKGAGQPYGAPGNTARDESSKLALNSWEDVADSEDEFHLNRDKILLDEGSEAKRRRKLQEEDAFLQPSEEEVLGYDETSDDEAEENDEGDNNDYADESEEELEAPKTHRKAKLADGVEEEEDLSGWGPSKSDYYNADAIETEQDALDEEAEALRIQKLQLQRMSAADFGLDEEDEEQPPKTEEGEDADEEEELVVTMTLPQPKLTEEVGPELRLKVLHDRYPEFEHLRRDLLELHPRASELKLLAEATLRTRGKSSPAQRQPVAVLKWRAITAYLGSISMYFALLTSTFGGEESDKITAMQPQLLHDHPVMESLLRCREIWNQVKNLPMDDIDSNELSVIEEELELPDAAMAGGEPAEENVPGEAVQDGMSPKDQHMQRRKAKAQRRAEKAQAEEEAREAEKSRKLDKELALLSELTSKDARRKIAKITALGQPLPAFDEDSDAGEETRLTEEALEEKARRKRSLKFYTSQIAQKANKRSAAGRDYGGDIDVPHRERLRDRQARLNAEAEKRGRKTLAPDEELGGESDEDDRRKAREVRGESDSEDLYEQVVSRKKKRKLDKQEAAEAYARAAAAGGQVVEREEIGLDGKRKITYAIEKNKGLTPHRKKDVRNPRVKKRRKFEEKKKKLKSIRAVYSGGEGKGGYGGELTGIKKGLIKSIKL